MTKLVLSGLICVFCLLLTKPALAAILFSQTAKQDVYEGETFVVEWYIDTEGKSINSIDLKLDYSTETLEPKSMSAGSSLISLWLSVPKAENGKISLAGGIPNGIISNKIAIFQSEFTAKTDGPAFIRLDPSSKILLNDGKGGLDQVKLRNVEFNIYPKNQRSSEITSSSHPDQSFWYTDNNVVIKFTPKEGVDYSYSFSSNIEIIPDDDVHTIPPQFTYKNLPDGVYYFKLNSKVGPSIWQEAGVYRIQIDNTAPESFIPLISSDPSINNGDLFISFSTLDKTAGISHYKARNGLFGRAKTANSPLKLNRALVGDKIEITAVDRAGNERVETVEYKGYLSVLQFILVLIGIGVLTLLLYIYRRKKLIAARAETIIKKT